MGKTYYPSQDELYDAWLANFVAMLTMNASMVGLLPADLTPITTSQAAFDASLTAYKDAKTMASSTMGAKATQRDQSEAILRPLVRRINNHPGMNDQLRRLLGLKTDDLVQSPTPIEALTPLVSLESGAGQVTIHWGPNPGNERSNGKPAGVKGANIYRKKAGDAEYQIVGFATASPHYDPIAGLGADYVYVVRYRGTKSTDLSQQSEAGTIAARGELAA